MTNSCLHTRVRYEPHDDELTDGVSFGLQIQIGVGETTETPVLQGYDFAWLRLESTTDIATPGAIFKRPGSPRCPLTYRNRNCPLVALFWTHGRPSRPRS